MAGNRNASLHVGAIVAVAFMATCTGSGGPGERTGQAPAALGVSNANLELKELTAACGDRDVQDYFRVTNNGTTAVRISDISIQLWADDTSGHTLEALVDSGGCVSVPHDDHWSGCGDHFGDDFCDGHCDDKGNDLNCDGGPVFGVTATASRMATACGPTPTSQADWQITISNDDHGWLQPGETWVAAGVNLFLNRFAQFSPGTADWYSGCLTGWDYQNPTHAALYVQGNLVTASTGVPPSCAAPSGSQPVPGSVPPQIASGQFPLVGPLAGTTNVTVTIAMPQVPQAGQPAIDDYIQSLYDPTSPQYGQYMTPGQFADAYGPSVASYDQVQSFATSNGLTVAGTYGSRTLLAVSGPASAVESAFYVTLNEYQRPDGSTFFAPANDPSVNLSVPLAHIGGLDNYALPRPTGGTGPSSCGAVTDPSGTHTTPMQAEYGGNDFKKAYLNPTALTYNGAHQTVAILAFDSYLTADTTAYATQFNSGVAYNLTQIPVVGGGSSGPNPPFSPGGNEFAVASDVEMVAAMVPAATINVYEVSPTPPPGVSQLPAADFELLLAKVADDDSAQVIANSWVWQGLATDPIVTAIFRQFAVQGQTFFQAAGDFGSYVASGPSGATVNAALGGTNGLVGGQTVPDPIMDSVYMTVVGGTALTTNASTVRTGETTWNDASQRGNYISVSGGGLLSGYTGYPALPIPSYQASLIPPDATTAQAALSFPVRMIPDVSIVSTQIATYVGGGSALPCANGTSLATGLWAGIGAMINEAAGYTPTSGVATLGYANPKLYTAAATTGNFNDIADGSDDNFAATLDNAAALYHASTGYDMATGLGSPGTSLVGTAAVPKQSCMPGANMTAMIQGRNVVAYVPNGSWTENTVPDIRAVVIEGAYPFSTTGGNCDTNGCTISSNGDAVNTCAADSVSGMAVCIGNDNNIFTIDGLNVTNTLHISPAPSLEDFSGGSCTTCNVAIDPTTHNGFVSFGLSPSQAAIEPIAGLTAASGTPTLGSPIPLNSEDASSEGVLVDPTRQILLSPNEDGDYQIIQLNSSETTGSVYDFMAPGAPIFDQAAEDCTTGIALASVEIYGTSTGGTTQLFLLDLTQAPLPGSGTTWSPPAYAYNLLTVPEFSAFVAGTDAVTVASPSHLAAITGEFGGDAFGVMLLPFTSGAGTPALTDYVVGTIPTTPVDGLQWQMGEDPHTLTSYTSPNTNKQYAIFQDDAYGNGTRTWLAVVDMQALLFDVPRSDGKTPSSGTTSHTIPAATLAAAGTQCMGPPAGTPGCVIGFIHN